MNGPVTSHSPGAPADSASVGAADVADPSMRDLGVHDLGVHEVSVERDAVRAFCAAARIAPSGAPPFSYPIVWLAGEAIKERVRALIGPDILPVQESQSFDYKSILLLDVDYRLSVSARREEKPDRLIVDGAVTSMSHHPMLTMRCVLRLVPIAPDHSARSPA